MGGGTSPGPGAEAMSSPGEGGLGGGAGVAATEAEGPGLRFALWFQGCPLRCPGCCNPEMLPFEGGTPLTLAEVLGRLDAAVAEHGVEGVSLLGGEPLAHAAGAAPFARAVR